jgi:hypothetical protein
MEIVLFGLAHEEGPATTRTSGVPVTGVTIA